MNGWRCGFMILVEILWYILFVIYVDIWWFFYGVGVSGVVVVFWFELVLVVLGVLVFVYCFV